MKYIRDSKTRVEDVKIAYVGGGSRGWAWGLMSDLASVEDMSGDVYLYDINNEAAKKNEHIGNLIKNIPEVKAAWNYKAVDTLKEALTGADFVVISILPGTFDEMQSDVHLPEKYGIYQSVGDTFGPGGLVRALRTIPMFEVIANAIKDYCPDAWVINYTNPMSVCVRSLYLTFPKIKAFGCCHEVFGTQKFLVNVLKETEGFENVSRDEIKANVVGVNHFTWITSAQYQGTDLYPVYDRFIDKYYETGYGNPSDDNWMNSNFTSFERVKMDLFRRFGVMAAAGDRHLAEFCPGDWYLKDPDTVDKWGFKLTKVSWRKEDLKKRLERSERLYSGEESFKLKETGEEGVQQMRALLGLRELVTNVNIPNVGQIPNLPIGAIVETNAVFRANSLCPVFAGSIPESIYPLVAKACGEEELTAKAAVARNLEMAFNVFINDPNIRLSHNDARALFDEMIKNTSEYLKEYK